ALGASGIVGTNVVLNSASATVSDSTLTTNAGDVTVLATNGATLTAAAVNSSSTSLEKTVVTKTKPAAARGTATHAAYAAGAHALGRTAAFNSIGWEPQNVLSSGLDALLGDTPIADAFGADKGSGATASLTNTVVHASGKVTVEAQTQTHIDADVGNTSKAKV